MTDAQLERFCERNQDCGCKCMKCPAFAANYHYNNGDDVYDGEEEYEY